MKIYPDSDYLNWFIFGMGIFIFLLCLQCERYWRRFPLLNFIILKKEIKKIVHKFYKAKISRVLLFHYEQNIGQPKNIPFEYVIVFYCKNPEADDFKTHAINLHTMPNDPARKQNLGIEITFKGVYRKNPPQNYLDEWRFDVLGLDEKPSEIDIRSFQYWIIWPFFGGLKHCYKNLKCLLPNISH
jgi:hypothetical protein